MGPKKILVNPPDCVIMMLNGSISFLGHGPSHLPLLAYLNELKFIAKQ